MRGFVKPYPTYTHGTIAIAYKQTGSAGSSLLQSREEKDALRKQSHNQISIEEKEETAETERERDEDAIPHHLIYSLALSFSFPVYIIFMATVCRTGAIDPVLSHRIPNSLFRNNSFLVIDFLLTKLHIGPYHWPKPLFPHIISYPLP